MSSNPQTDSWIKIGQIGSVYGVHGWLKINSYTVNLADILRYSPWYLSAADQTPALEKMLPVVPETGRSQGKGIIAKIPGYDSPEDARQLTGKIIYIKKEQLPPLPPHEYYWSDLIGLKVFNARGECLGTVKSIIETGSNDVLVVQGKQTFAIPYLPQTVILSVDLNTQTILVDWEVV